MGSVNPAVFRQAALRFATGVAVLTALDERGEVCGMTVNSFVTVSLFPPTVLVSVKPGRIHRAISGRRRYGVNVLPEGGKGLSRQLYNILGKIREVDALQSPSLQERLFEACPELSFALMSRGVPMRHNKRTVPGRAERVAALRASGFGDVVPIVDAPPAGAARDDVLDALALAWTARRSVAGSVRRLGGERDESGLRMEVIA